MKIANILDEATNKSNGSSVKVFENSEFGNIRVFIDEINGPWFCLSDICKSLDLTPKGVNQRLSDEVVSNYPIIDRLGRTQNALFVNEDGLYDVIFESRKPEARSFRKWVTSKVLPSIRKTGKYSIKEETSSISKEEYELRMKEINAKTAELFLEIGDRTSIPEYKNILNSYAANTLAGKEILALPEVNEKTFSATEIGNILGVSANKIGKISNLYKMKTPEYGKFFYDKSRYSNKEVETFRYYEKAINKFKELINK